MKRLERAERRAADAAVFHEEIAGSLVDYVADRANRSAAGLKYDELDAILAGGGVPQALRSRYHRCLETCDFARFTPDAGRDGARADVLREARGILKALEESW